MGRAAEGEVGFGGLGYVGRTGESEVGCGQGMLV